MLFLVADDMRAQIGAYEGKHFPAVVSPKMHTPNLDTLASRSLLFERTYCQLAICAPSRSSLLTGRRPDTLHVYEIGPYFREVSGNFTTLPQYFKNNGYLSIGMGKIFHKGASSGYDDPVSWSEPYFHGVANFESKNKSWEAIPDEILKDTPLIDEQIANQAIQTLQRVAPDAKSGKQPFFVAVGFQKPHLPFVFPESFLKYYPASSVKLPINPYIPVNMPDAAWFDYRGLRRHADIRSYNVTGEINSTMPHVLTLQLRRAYFCAVSWADSLIGRVLAELDDLGLSDNTIVSFFSDHGYTLGEHSEWTKQTNFELATHSPMMVSIPGLTDKGIRTEQLTELIDLFPTLVEASGLKQLPVCSKSSSKVALCREGSSLLPLIKQPNKPVKKAVFSQYPRCGRMGYSIRTDRFRYTEWVKFSREPDFKADWDDLCGVELYDHLIDRAEDYNRAYDDEYAGIRKELSRMLREGWRKSVVR